LSGFINHGHPVGYLFGGGRKIIILTVKEYQHEKHILALIALCEKRFHIEFQPNNRWAGKQATEN